MTNSNTPRWLVVWGRVAACAIAFTLIWGFCESLVFGHSRPEGEATLPLRYPRSQNVYYVTPIVRLMHDAVPLVAFSIMGSLVLVALLVEQREQTSSWRATAERIACAPFPALLTYLIGLGLCFVPFAAGLTVDALPFVPGAWTVYWILTIVVMRRRQRRRGQGVPSAKAAPN